MPQQARYFQVGGKSAGYFFSPTPKPSQTTLIIPGHPAGVACLKDGTAREGYALSSIAQYVKDEHAIASMSLIGSPPATGSFSEKTLPVLVDAIHRTIRSLEVTYETRVTTIIGPSMGGIYALATLQQKQHNVTRLITAATPGDARQAIVEDFGSTHSKPITLEAPGKWFNGQVVTSEYMRSVKEFDVEQALRSYQGSVHAILAGDDKDYSDGLTQLFVQRAKEAGKLEEPVHTIEGADHRFSEHVEQLANIIKDILAGRDPRKP